MSSRTFTQNLYEDDVVWCLVVMQANKMLVNHSRTDDDDKVSPEEQKESETPREGRNPAGLKRAIGLGQVQFLACDGLAHVSEKVA